MLQSIIVYIFVIPLFYLLAKRNIRVAKIGRHSDVLCRDAVSFYSTPCLLILLLFSILAGVRYNVGADYLGYLYSYLNYDALEYSLKYEYEPGFLFVMKLFHSLGLSPMLFFGFIAFLQLLFFLLAFKNERHLWPLLLLFFFTNGGYMLWMNGLRQSLAMCVWIYSLKYIEEKKLIWYLGFCGLAFLFHSSAIVLCIFYPILIKGRPFFQSIPLQYIIIIAAFIARVVLKGFFYDIAVFYVYVTGGGYENYLEKLTNFTASSNTNIVFWYRIFVYCIIIAYSGKMRQFYNKERFNNIYTLFFIGVTSLCIIPQDMALLSRPFMYFTFFDSIMLAYFVYYLSKHPGQTNSLIMIMMIVSFIGVFLGNQMVSSEDSSVWYQFYFDQPQNVMN